MATSSEWMLFIPHQNVTRTKSFFLRCLLKRDSNEVLSFLDLEYFSYQSVTRMKSFFPRSQVFFISNRDSDEVTSFLDLKYFSHQIVTRMKSFLDLKYFSHQNVTQMKSSLSMIWSISHIKTRSRDPDEVF